MSVASRLRGAHFVVDCQGQAYTVQVTGEGITYKLKGIRNAQAVGKSWTEVLSDRAVQQNIKQVVGQ